MWFLIFTVLSLEIQTILVKGACTKFTSESDLAMSVMVQGRCVYGFSNGKQYTNAIGLCESEGTQLIVLKTEEDQAAAWNALGSNFGQHWMGLTKKDGIWQWKDAGAWLTMTSSRWEAVQNGDAAYTMSSENRYLWKMTSSDSWYRPVCEESTASTPPDPAPTVTQAVTEPTVTTSVITVPTVTPQAVTTQPLPEQNRLIWCVHIFAGIVFVTLLQGA